MCFMKFETHTHNTDTCTSMLHYSCFIIIITTDVDNTRSIIVSVTDDLSLFSPANKILLNRLQLHDNALIGGI